MEASECPSSPEPDQLIQQIKRRAVRTPDSVVCVDGKATGNNNNDVGFVLDIEDENQDEVEDDDVCIVSGVVNKRGAYD